MYKYESILFSGDKMYKVEITGVDTSKLKTLTSEVMNELIISAHEGNMDARNKLIEGNLKLVLSVIKRFNNRNEEADDLFQVGCIGLMKAIDNFDLSHNVKFSTYAVPMIIGEIRRHLRDSGSLRVSRSYKDLAYKALALKEKMYKESHEEPKMEEIAKALNVEVLDIVLALEAIQDTISMSTPIYDNGGDVIELEDQIGSDERLLDKVIERTMLTKAFTKLDEREKTIIYNRYFLDKTQTEIAEELQISQAQVSRLEKGALKIMYDFMNS